MAPPLPLVAASPAAFDAMVELSSAKVAPLDWKKIPPAKPAAVGLAPALLPDIVVLVSVVDPLEPGCSKIAPPKPPAPGPATVLPHRISGGGGGGEHHHSVGRRKS